MLRKYPRMKNFRKIKYCKQYPQIIFPDGIHIPAGFWTFADTFQFSA